MAQRTTNLVNGVNVNELVGHIDAMQENPSLAEFKFRTQTEWIDGAHAQTRVQSFYGAGREDESRTRPFVLEGDEPQILLGANRAPNAVETVLHALASCLAVGFAYNAAAQGIEVEDLSFEIEGDLDLHAFLGISDAKRPGFSNIDVSYRVRADAPREKIEELCSYVQDTSPVLDILRNPTNVSVSLKN